MKVGHLTKTVVCFFHSPRCLCLYLHYVRVCVLRNQNRNLLSYFVSLRRMQVLSFAQCNFSLQPKPPGKNVSVYLVTVFYTVQ